MSSSSSPPFSSTSFLLTTTISLLLLSISSHPLPISATKPPPSTPTTTAPPPPPRPFKKIFAFGDSFTDTGNTRSVTGPSGFGHVSNPPYGVTFFHHSTNRYSDGRLVIDFVTEYLSLPFLPPYLHIVNRKRKNDTHLTSAAGNGVNFAFAGSTAINYEFFARNNLSLDISPHSILSQLVWFNKYMESEGCGGKGECKEVFEESLFWIGEIGVNDYAYTIGSPIDGDVIQKLALNSVTAFLEVITSDNSCLSFIGTCISDACY